VSDARETNNIQKTVNLIFLHQLFAERPLLDNGHVVYLIEVNKYRFHKKKIARASMRYYQQYLKERGGTVHYIDTNDVLSDIQQFRPEITKNKITTICYIDLTDDWLEKRIKRIARDCLLQRYPSPQFLNNEEALTSFFRLDRTSFFQTTFYKQQRIKRNILLADQQ
jgi:deoxyribodipyrimidine photolyase-related protein